MIFKVDLLIIIGYVCSIGNVIYVITAHKKYITTTNKAYIYHSIICYNAIIINGFLSALPSIDLNRIVGFGNIKFALLWLALGRMWLRLRTLITVRSIVYN